MPTATVNKAIDSKVYNIFIYKSKLYFRICTLLLVGIRILPNRFGTQLSSFAINFGILFLTRIISLGALEYEIIIFL